MRVIGTAGHVDHGKSTLVAALTGIHPDRLKEEQEREMTIDLGFAWLSLPGGEDIGIVDVPGHRDFIENMLAGVGGIDAALFIVAADEGVMPQTREHLAILDVLQVDCGVIVLTKTDLIDDAEWLDLVEMDVRDEVANTVLADAPIVRVSARDGSGLETLKAHLAEVLAERPRRVDLGRPRLPVDRVFTIAGFGTVVTGTLLDGSFHNGDEVIVLPGAERGRIRGLQNHKRKVQHAEPGSRTAVNVSGLDVHQVARGDVLTLPGQYQPTRRLDLQFRLLADAGTSIFHDMQVKLFVGSAEVLARVRLLGTKELLPGQSGWLQLETQEPVTVVRGDRYILRRPSPGETLGGGMVLDPHPPRRHKRFSEAVLQNLESLYQGSDADLMFQASLARGVAPLKDVVKQAHLSEESGAKAAQELIEAGRLVVLEPDQKDPLVVAVDTWQKITAKALQWVSGFHGTHPLRKGISREELKSRLKFSPAVFNAVMDSLVHEQRLEQQAALVFLPGHEVRFTFAQQTRIDELMQRFADEPYKPPSIRECQAEVGEDVYFALVDLDRLVPVSKDIAFRREEYDHMLAELRAHFAAPQGFSLGMFRDHFNTSRKYALAFLEHLDSLGITTRGDDVRFLR
ncbi:MAG: selenocysteine-specific translation elongation factor [Anaerolineaceae bacterium]|nr:selenocysteine-specific translation elongation factor [Anaerolineaceae bacterium]